MHLLLTGASGQLGAWIGASTHAGDLVSWPGPRGGGVDLTDADAVADALAAARPDIILHTAALSRVADCHLRPDLARSVNVAATATLAELAERHGIRLVFVSTDMVFDGESAPYRDDAVPSPLSVYGRSKAEAERIVLAGRRNAVVRISLLFGPSRCGRPSFFDEQIAALRAGRHLALFEDEWRTPLDLDTAARALPALARSDVVGIVHLGGPERLSRLEMGRRLAAVLGVDDANIRAVTRADLAAPEPRPRDLSLDSTHWRSLFPDLPWPTYEAALRTFLNCRVDKPFTDAS
jgi:dTDP-4-dehydrorhamnose reductase